MNILAIDWGSRRWGLARGDELGLAFPLSAAVEPEIEDRWKHLETEARRLRPQLLVVGYPVNMDESVGFKAREVDAFIAELEKRLGLPVHRQDERLTSSQAEMELYAAGLKPKRDRDLRALGTLDSRAAAILLQDYLDLNFAPAAGLMDSDHGGEPEDSAEWEDSETDLEPGEVEDSEVDPALEADPDEEAGPDEKPRRKGRRR